MQILRRYLFKEWSSSFALSLLVFTFILLIGNLLKLAEVLVSKETSFFLIIKLFAFQLPYCFSYAIPMSVIASSLISFGRLSSDNEILAIRSSGIKLYTVILPFLLLGAFLTFFSFTVNNNLVPYTYHQTKVILHEIGSSFPVIPQFDESVIIDEFKDFKIYIGRIERKKLKDLTIIFRPPEEEGKEFIFSAKEGLISSTNDKQTISIKLINGSMHELDPKDKHKYHKIDFNEQILHLPTGFDFAAQKKLKAMSVGELRSALRENPEIIKRYPILTEIHRKLSLSFTCLVFFLFSIPLGIQSRKAGKATNIAISFIFFLIYYIFLAGGKALGNKGTLPPYFVMWLPNILLGTLGAFLLYRLERK